jgi:hypothetical protein
MYAPKSDIVVQFGGIKENKCPSSNAALYINSP